jgi:anti-sigma B factor antagonist
MTITTRTIDDVTILDIKGTVTIGVHADRLRDKVRSLLQQGTKHILLNLAEISYIDSAGLGELISAHAAATRQSGALKLLNTTKRVANLLVITKLATVFETFDDERQAIESFNKESMLKFEVLGV